MTHEHEPASTDVAAGDDVTVEDYNELRNDTIFFGSPEADAVDKSDFFDRYSQHVKLEYLATNKIRIPYNAFRPPVIKHEGHMLKATDNVDSPAASGASGFRYVKAIRAAGSTTFTITVSDTTSAEGDLEQFIGLFFWDGSNIVKSSIVSQEDQDIALNDQHVAHAWGHITAAGVITNHMNILSVTRPATGTFSITMITGLENANYAVMATTMEAGGTFAASDQASFTTTFFQIIVRTDAGAPSNTGFFFVIFGDR